MINATLAIELVVVSALLVAALATGLGFYLLAATVGYVIGKLVWFRVGQARAELLLDRYRREF